MKLISSLEIMENIVAKNKNLFWDGWTVVSKSKSLKGMSSTNGARIDGEWYVLTRYEPSRSGWSIPDRLVGENA